MFLSYLIEKQSSDFIKREKKNQAGEVMVYTRYNTSNNTREIPELHTDEKYVLWKRGNRR